MGSQVRAGTAVGYLAGSAALDVSPPLLLTGRIALQGYRPLRKRNSPSVDDSDRRSGMAPTQSANCVTCPGTPRWCPGTPSERRSVGEFALEKLAFRSLARPQAAFCGTTWAVTNRHSNGALRGFWCT